MEVAKVESMTLVDETQAVGSLRSRQGVMLRPEVAGRVKQIFFNDGQRVRYIVDLVRRGHGCQIVVAHDICTRTRLRRFGGHGYGHLLENAVPLMRRRGLSAEDLTQILVATPRRLLAFA